MRVILHKDQTADVFLKQLCEIGNEKTRNWHLDQIIKSPLISVSWPNRTKNSLDAFFQIQGKTLIGWVSEQYFGKKIKWCQWCQSDQLNLIPGQLFPFESVDTIKNKKDGPTQFLNSLKLQLKIGLDVIMVRNINQTKLCNWMRLFVKMLLNNVTKWTIIKGKFKISTKLNSHSI